MYSAEDISWIDIDWFAVDALGRIGQFATGGGVWPPSPAREHRSENEALLSAIKARPVVTSAVTALNLLDLTGFTDEYAEAFSLVAARGLFAFDKIRTDGGVVEYRCVAAPADHFLTLEEMSRVAANLERVLVSCRDHTFAVGTRIRIPS
jgi:hypothetical protein